MDQLIPIDISIQKAAEYIFFSIAPVTFSSINHIMSHKSSLGKFKKMKLYQAYFYDHNAMRLDIDYRKNDKKHKHMEPKQYTSK